MMILWQFSYDVSHERICRVMMYCVRALGEEFNEEFPCWMEWIVRILDSRKQTRIVIWLTSGRPGLSIELLASHSLLLEWLCRKIPILMKTLHGLFFFSCSLFFFLVEEGGLKLSKNNLVILTNWNVKHHICQYSDDVWLTSEASRLRLSTLFVWPGWLKNGWMDSWTWVYLSQVFCMAFPKIKPLCEEPYKVPILSTEVLLNMRHQA